MTARAMLDTNAVSVLMRDPFGSLRRRAEAFGFNDLCISVVSTGELQFGLAKSGSTKIRRALGSILDTLPIAGLEPPVDRTYGEIRAHLSARGEIIGPNDTWIAAHALALNLILVTANVREFSRVPDLRVENWLD